jgi:hypothetical protein
VVEDAAQQAGDRAVARPGEGERRDGRGDGSYQTKTVIAPSRSTMQAPL